MPTAQSTNVFQDNVTPLFPSSETRHTNVQTFASEWFDKLTSRLQELTSLPSGWDGYGGQAVSFNCALFAASLIERLFVEDLDAPQLVPGGDGSLQIEWHENGFDIEIHVLAPYDVAATRLNLASGHVDELELQSDFTVLADWVTELCEAQTRGIQVVSSTI